jgi:hypothetical protein
MKNVAQTLRKTSRGKKEDNSKRYVFPLPDQLIGLEVEVDTPERNERILAEFRWPEQYAPYWNKTRDGSLRNGSEYVLAAPMAGNMLSDAVCKLFAGGTSIFRTTTGSTHIHVDMLEDDTPIACVQVLVLLLFMLEGAIFAACDPGREWCGYTNKLSSAPDALLGAILNCDLNESPDSFIDAIAGQQASLIGRYYGLNLQALHKYGSVEFRYFPTATSADELASWVTMVQMFKKAALDIGTVSNLQEVVENESRYNDLIATYFGPWLDAFMKEVPHYKAVGSFQKALATAASQQCRVKNSRWSDEFDPRAITGSKVYSKLIKKRKRDANVREGLQVNVCNDDDPTPTAVSGGPLLVSNGTIYLPITSTTGRATWASITAMNASALTTKVPLDYMERALETLLSRQHHIVMQAGRYARRAQDNCTLSRSLLERAILAMRQRMEPAPTPVEVSYDYETPAPSPRVQASEWVTSTYTTGRTAPRPSAEQLAEARVVMNRLDAEERERSLRSYTIRSSNEELE